MQVLPVQNTILQAQGSLVCESIEALASPLNAYPVIRSPNILVESALPGRPLYQARGRPLSRAAASRFFPGWGAPETWPRKRHTMRCGKRDKDADEKPMQ